MKKPASFVVLAIIFLACAGDPTSGPSQCQVAEASRLPAYAIQGTWSPDESQLLLVDPVYEQVHVYAKDTGRYRGVLKTPASIDESAFFPKSARTFGDELVIETFPQQLLFLGDRNELKDRREPLQDLRTNRASRDGALLRKGASSGTPGTLESMFLWTFVQDDIVACGDIRQADGSWVTGIVRFSVDRPRGFKVYETLDPRDLGRVFCQLELPYMTAIGDDAFVLLMNDEPGIYRIGANGDSERLDYPLTVGGDLRLLDFINQAEFVGTMEAAERASMPVGLYSSNDRLFILYREIDHGDTGFRWLLDEVSPVTGKRVGRAIINSTAPHLMLVPGEETWALVENGRVTRFGEQPTQRIRLLDSSSIEQPLRGTLCAE